MSEAKQRPVQSDKTHFCLTCGKAFRNKSQLTQHELVHNGIRKHVCSYCDKAFKQICHLNQHIRVHTGQRLYRCTIRGCGRAFAQLSNLNNHQKNHGVFPDVSSHHRCEMCDQSNANKNTLKTQMMKIDERPNKCTMKGCGWSFAQPSNLNDHQNSHGKNVRRDMPSQYRCEVCDRSYANLNILQRHIIKELAITQSAKESLKRASCRTEIAIEENIPDAVPKGRFTPVHLPVQDPTFVIIDLETTGLIEYSNIPQITQIAAVCGHKSFNQYVTPTVPITREASGITGIVYNNGKMTVHDEDVQPVKIDRALKDFIEWLRQFPNCVLIAHNGKRFDFPVMMTALSKSNLLSTFTNITCAFADSLHVFRKKIPGLRSYRQAVLVSGLLNASYNAHNALDDVNALQDLLQFADLSPVEIMRKSFSPIAVFHKLQFRQETNKNIASLYKIIDSKVCNRTTAKNIAGSGLNMSHLQKIYQRNGQCGLRCAFTQTNCDGLIRVTNSKRILDTVIPKLVDYLDKKIKLN